MFGDGVGGVFVVGFEPQDGTLSPKGLVVQRYGTAGWTAPAIELRGLKTLQTVAIDQGVALFGRDDTFWYRKDYTSAGPQPIQTLFAVEYPVYGTATLSAAEIGFTRTHDGAILATAFVPRGDAEVAQLREFRQGVWSSPEQVALLLPFTDLPPVPVYTLPRGSVVRTKYGDVATISFDNITPNTFSALRQPAETAFTPVTINTCESSRCQPFFGYYSFPALEQDGSATVARRSQTKEWLAVRSNSPTELWPATVAAGSAPSDQNTKLLRSDGSPVWLATVGEMLTIWEGTRQSLWAADASELALCPVPACAAFSTPEIAHVATLHVTSPAAATLFVSHRADDGRWSNGASIDLSALLAKAGTVAQPLYIAGFHADRFGQIVVGYGAQPNDAPALAHFVTVFALRKL